LQQTSFPKTKSKYIFKNAFQNILTIEEGFYHENPSIAASKIFLPKWHYKPWNFAQPQCYYATILEILPILSNSNTSNYILITLNPHTLPALFTKSSTLKIGDNPCINLSPYPYNTAQAPKISIPPTHIGITKRHDLMPSSYKIKIIVILGSSTFTIP
jgi:hypothetical protein